MSYDEEESRLARRNPDEVVGRDIFGQVAPCTRVRAFEGRFRAMVQMREPGARSSTSSSAIRGASAR